MRRSDRVLRGTSRGGRRNAGPLGVDVRARHANADLVLQFENQNVVGNTGDLADDATTGDDLIALGQLGQGLLHFLLADF